MLLLFSEEICKSILIEILTDASDCIKTSIDNIHAACVESGCSPELIATSFIITAFKESNGQEDFNDVAIVCTTICAYHEYKRTIDRLKAASKN